MGLWRSMSTFGAEGKEQVAGLLAVLQSPCAEGLRCIRLQLITGTKISRICFLKVHQGNLSFLAKTQQPEARKDAAGETGEEMLYT